MSKVMYKSDASYVSFRAGFLAYNLQAIPTF